MTTTALMQTGQTTVAGLNCPNCDHCLTREAVGADLRPLRNHVRRRITLSKGDTLAHAGQKPRAVHIVRSGSFKLVTICPEGEEQIVSFRLPGEVLGLVDMFAGYRATDTVALEASEVWEIPFGKANRCVERELYAEAMAAIAHRVQWERHQLWRRNHYPAADRIGGLLLDLSARAVREGSKVQRFRLSMPRCDIANYLGMKVETVSRGLATLQEQKLIAVSGRNIKLFDPARLAAKCHWQASRQSEGVRLEAASTY